MRSQTEKAETFRALHHRDTAFLIPNPWDAGSALLLQNLGYEAIATTSAGFAFTQGRRDNAVTRESVLFHIAQLTAACNLPLSADLENGFGDSPETVAETIRLAAAAGAVGGSIEDATNNPATPIYDLAAAVDRIAAAAAAARALDFPFTLTARCENYLVGRPNLADTIARLQAYQQAGADVLFAPGLTRRDDIAAVLSSIDRPFNLIMAIPGMEVSFAEAYAMGVRRVSVGSALSRAALTAFVHAAEEMRDHGTFNFAADAIPYRALNAMFPEKS